MQTTKFNSDANKFLLKDICESDKTGIFEAVSRLAIEHGMPFDNIAGFLFDFSAVITKWAKAMDESINEKAP